MAASRRVGRRTITVSNLDKVLFPSDGVTKSDLIDYYSAIATAMLPHLRRRPVTLERFPDGIDHHRVYSKDAPDYFPSWIARATLAKEGGIVTHVVCNDRPTLVYLANQATITPHVALSRVDKLHHPDQVVWDLDPASDDLAAVPRTAHAVRRLLQDIGLPSFPKSSGSKGIHVVTPLDRRAGFEEVRSLARDAAALLAARHSDRITIEQRKGKRAGRLCRALRDPGSPRRPRGAATLVGRGCRGLPSWVSDDGGGAAPGGGGDRSVEGMEAAGEIPHACTPPPRRAPRGRERSGRLVPAGTACPRCVRRNKPGCSVACVTGRCAALPAALPDLLCALQNIANASREH